MTEKNKQHDASVPDVVKSDTDTQLQSGQGNDRPKEIGGRKKGLEPTRYGDWEKNGRCIDF